MPTYAHECATHGEFDDLRPISRCAEDAACPACGAACARVVTVPRLSSMDRNTRIAHARNEQSRHAPHVCSTGCGHDHGRKPVSSTYQPQKLEAYKGPRPWVIEHGCT